ncbi:MAG: hypothetical protein IAF02_12445 [Anaerolineae bacterium]|nr:hypothetical protein [Anaerolineae bacterium]
MKTKNRKRLSTKLILLGILLLILGLAATPALARRGQVPLRGRFSGVGETFSGRATHLGRFDGVIDNTTDPPNAVWTAANGDTLTNITTSFVIDFSAPIEPDVYPYTQTIEFTGGNGRFQNATGSAEITGTINVVTFEYNGRIEGTISRPNGH